MNRQIGKQMAKYVPLAAVLILLTWSFIHGWYFDYSKPFMGSSLEDQRVYSATTQRLSHGALPSLWHLHFSIGYPLLGVLGHILSPHDPFVAISFLLLIASAIFCFLAVQKLFGSLWALVFSGLLFYWDGVARTFTSASELFAIPWNNQVFFFAMAFYLWLLVCKSNKVPSWRLLIIVGIISGVCFLTREETILFIVPLTATYLAVTKSNLNRWVVCYGIIMLCYLPQVIIKALVLSKAPGATGDRSYGGLWGEYFKPGLVRRNAWETILDSRHIIDRPYPGPNVHRQALLQAAPWLWLSPIGVGMIVLMKRYSAGLKVFVLVSCAIVLFYLSGPNMSAYKLRFHCLRYVTPAFIALNLATVTVARETLYGIRKVAKRSV